jgi:hypothetical protein
MEKNEFRNRTTEQKSGTSRIVTEQNRSATDGEIPAAERN